MSINDKNNGRGKIVMLALMMVTSTFAVIGTTAADPTGMEIVMWDAENGEMYTHEDGEQVYEYEYPEDALYDFKFTSDGLDIGDSYGILMVLVDVSANMDVYEIMMEWQATDYDGDGVADNSSEFLVDGSVVDMIHNDTCYAGEAMLFFMDGPSGPEEIAHISQLIGFGDYECNWGEGDYEEHLTMEFRGANYDDPQPKYDDHSETNIILIPSNLHEPMSWCENTTTGEEVDADEVDCEADPNTMWIEEDLTYDIHYWLTEHETGEMVEVIFELVVELDEYDVDVSANGCYDLYAELYLNLTQTADGQTEDYYESVSHSMEGFSVGKDCFTPPADPPFVWSKADRVFNPEMEMFDYYGDGDSIVIEYGAWNLEPETTYTSMLLILGPFSPDDEHHEGPSFICGDGSEVPFEYVNDGDQDCPDGADEQQYNDDGTKLNWFDCHDGTQIWIDQVNDGVEDCAHGEDEAGDHDHDDGHGEEPHTDDGSEDGSLDGDDGTEHDDEESDEYCYDMDNNVVTEHENQEDCEYEGYMWVKEDGEEPDGPETALEVIMDQETSLEGDFFTDYIIEPGVLESGFYASMHVVITADGLHFPQEEEPSLLCVGESTCEFGPGEISPWEHTTGHGYYQMHFDQFENHESPDGMSFNGILELSSVETIDSSYRMFADTDGDGNVDPIEAMTFLSILAEGMNDEGPHEECQFDKDHPDSPCNVEACSPEGYTEEGCHTAIEEYCALYPDPACDGMTDECPFWNDVDDSPCNVEACGPDGDDAACWDAVMTYCENYPEDPGCDDLDDMEECPFDMDNPDSPCNYEPCDPMSEEHNESACHSKVEAYCADNPEDEGCHHDEHDDGTEGDDDGTGASSADGRHCVPEGEVCPEDGGDHDHGVEGGDDDYEDDDMLVTLDGVVLGESTFEWIWMDGLVGPVDGSDGMPVTVISGQVWELNLEDWKTTDMHVVELSSTNADKPLVSQCNEDGLRGHGEVGHGVFAVYDSWAWSPEEPELEGDGWLVEADGEYGWNAPFNCADQGELQTLTVTFSKTLKDYNAGNLEAEEAGVDGYDWEQDVEDNQAPTCHVFASTTNDGTNWEESEDHFEAPDGDYTIELTPGVWFLSVYCKDPDGDMVMGQVTANGEVFEFLEEEEGHAFAEFPVMAGMPNLTVEYKWDSTGGHSGSGTITLVVEIIEDSTVDEIVEPITNDDGTLTCPDNLVLSDDQTQCVAPSVDNVGDIIEEVAADEGGSIPGFTTALSVISMLGAVLVMSRRKEDC